MWLALCLAGCMVEQVRAQTATSADYDALWQRLEQQSAEIEQLKARLAELPVIPAGHVEWNEPTDDNCVPVPARPSLPVVVQPPGQAQCSDSEASAAKSWKMRYYADYDKGFRIRPIDPDRDPFSLKVNGWIQFRHNAYESDVSSWTDNAGVTRGLRDRNDFDIERGRLIFSGSALVPELTYFLHLDGDTDGAEAVDFFDYWWGYQLSDQLQLQMGKRKVPGSRQWLLTARRTRFVDRPMANDYFRPDRTTGVFLVGETEQNLHYELMVGNGYFTANQPLSQLDTNFAYAGTLSWDPLGPFGEQLVDYEQSACPLVRVGHSATIAQQNGNPNGTPTGEADVFRLTDGTKITDPNAITPGVTVTDFDVFLYSLDAAWKWRGWSMNGELYARWLNDLSGTGPVTDENIFQYGSYIEGGVFLIPRRLDLNLRYSTVRSDYGFGNEYAIGATWYPRETPLLKVTMDVSRVERSPLNNTTSDILVGEDGLLFRTQFQAEF